jgi:hypothetical protein
MTPIRTIEPWVVDYSVLMTLNSGKYYAVVLWVWKSAHSIVWVSNISVESCDSELCRKFIKQA